MKFKIPKTYKKIIVNKEKGIVTTLLFLKGDPKKKFVGVAKCSPTDNFDEKIGSEISYKRAKRDLLIAIREEYLRQVKNGERYARVNQEICDKLTKKIKEIKESIYNSFE